MTHQCHALNCKEKCEPQKIMCLAHWRMVPLDLQSAIYNSYRRGQCDDKRPSSEWIKLARQAISHVARLEQK